MVSYSRWLPCMALAWLVLPAAAAATGSNATNPQAGDASTKQAECILIDQSSGTVLNCTGGLVMAAVEDNAFLDSRSTGFQSHGVALNPSCYTPGCMLTICGRSKVVLRGGAVQLQASSFYDSVLCVANSSQATIQDSVFAKNLAARAVFGMHDARIVLVNTTIAGNSLLEGNGAGVRLTDKAEVFITAGSVIARNLAPGIAGESDGNGGGVFAGSYAVVTIIDSNITDNQCNKFGGGVMASLNARVNIQGSSVISGNDAENGGGVAVLGNATLFVSRDVLFGGNGITKPENFGFDVYASGTQPVQLPQDCGGVSRLDSSADQPSALKCITKCSFRVSLDRGSCGAGMGWDLKTRGCICCPEFSYSFEEAYDAANDTFRQIDCKPCPTEGARCPGGNVVIALPGYSRSSLLSDQVHQCPLREAACAGSDQCRADGGYTGLLCTKCLPGFGTTSACQCGQCMDPKAQFGLYILLVVVLVAFVAATVHVSWKGAEKAAQLAATGSPPGARGLEPAEGIKVLVQFLQYLVIIGSISVPWPFFIVGMFKAASAVFGASGQAVSLDCWLEHYSKSKLPLAVQRQLVPFVAFVVVLLAVVALQVVVGAVMAIAQGIIGCFKRPAQAKRGRGCCDPLVLVLSKLPLTIMVATFYAFPSLLRATLGFFACLRVDSAGVGTAATAALKAHAQGYWVGDTNQECFVGWHKAWALGWGIPFLVVLCIGVPGGIFWVLKANDTKAANVDFRRHFGFLYCSFKVPERVWWEAVWAVQTIALSAVASFHFQLEAYYSMLLLAIILCMSIAAQQVFKPYEVDSLGVMHLSASVCLLSTVFGALAMFSVDKSSDTLKPVHVTVSALVLVMNVLMVGWCVVTIVRAALRGKFACTGKGKASRTS